MRAKKVLALLTAVCFAASSLLPPHAQAEAWKQKSGALRAPDLSFPGAAPLLSTQDFSALEGLEKPIPAALSRRFQKTLGRLSLRLGRVQNISLPAGDHPEPPIVVHILDVHRNEEAQRNISGLVSSLLEDAPAFVGLEGEFSTLDLAPYRGILGEEPLRHAADSLLRSHDISGAVHAALLTPAVLPPFLGIDDAALHRANVDAYRRNAARLPDIQRGLFRRERDLSRRRQSIFSTALRSFDRRVRAYHAGGPLADYVRALSGAGAPLPAAAAALLSALDMEAALDFKEVEAQRRALLQALNDRLDRGGLEEMVGWAAAFRAGALSNRDFHTRLTGLARRHGVSLNGFPALAAYLRYVSSVDGIHGESLFTALAAAERAGYARLAASTEERALVDEGRQLGMARKLADFSLTPEEWDGGRGFTLDGDLDGLADFYRRAEDRDRAMAERFVAHLKARRGKSAVLVTGGFHGPGLDAFLTRAGCAVVRVSPVLTEVRDAKGTDYLSAFDRDVTPLQKLFSGQGLFVADRGLHPAAVRSLLLLEGTVHGDARPAETLLDTAAVAADVRLSAGDPAEKDVKVRMALSRPDGGRVEVSGVHTPEEGFEDGIRVAPALTAKGAAFLSALEGVQAQAALLITAAAAAALATGGAAYGILRGTAKAVLAVLGGRTLRKPLVMAAALAMLGCGSADFLAGPSDNQIDVRQPDRDYMIAQGPSHTLYLGDRAIPVYGKYPEDSPYHAASQEMELAQHALDAVVEDAGNFSFNVQGFVLLPTRTTDTKTGNNFDGYVTIFLDEMPSMLGSFRAHVDGAPGLLAGLMVHEILGHGDRMSPELLAIRMRLFQNNRSRGPLGDYAWKNAEEFGAEGVEIFYEGAQSLLRQASVQGESETVEQNRGDVEAFLFFAARGLMRTASGGLLWRAPDNMDGEYLDPVDYPMIVEAGEKSTRITAGFMTVETGFDAAGREGVVLIHSTADKKEIYYDDPDHPIPSVFLDRVLSPADNPLARPIRPHPVALDPKTKLSWGLFSRRTPEARVFEVGDNVRPFAPGAYSVEAPVDVVVHPKSVSFLSDDLIGIPFRRPALPGVSDGVPMMWEVDDYVVASRSEGERMALRSAAWPFQVEPETASVSEGLLSIRVRPWVISEFGAWGVAPAREISVPVEQGVDTSRVAAPPFEILTGLPAWPAPADLAVDADPALWASLPAFRLAVHRGGTKEASAHAVVALRGKELFVGVEVHDEDVRAGDGLLLKSTMKETTSVHGAFVGQDAGEASRIVPFEGGYWALFRLPWKEQSLAFEWTDLTGEGDTPEEIEAGGGTAVVTAAGLGQSKPVVRLNTPLGISALSVFSYMTNFGEPDLSSAGKILLLATLAGALFWPLLKRMALSPVAHRVWLRLATPVLSAFLLVLAACSGGDGAPRGLEPRGDGWKPDGDFTASATASQEPSAFRSELSVQGEGRIHVAPARKPGGSATLRHDFAPSFRTVHNGFLFTFIDDVFPADIAFAVKRGDLPVDPDGQVRFKIRLSFHDPEDPEKLLWVEDKVETPEKEWGPDAWKRFQLKREMAPEGLKVLSMGVELNQDMPEAPGSWWIDGPMDVMDYRSYMDTSEPNDVAMMKELLDALGPDPAAALPSPAGKIQVFHLPAPDVPRAAAMDILRAAAETVPGLSKDLQRVYAAPRELAPRGGPGVAVVPLIVLPETEALVDNGDQDLAPFLFEKLAEAQPWAGDDEAVWTAWFDQDQQGTISPEALRAHAAARHVSGSAAFWADAVEKKRLGALKVLLAAVGIFAVRDGDEGLLLAFDEPEKEALSPALPWIIRSEEKGKGRLLLGNYAFTFGPRGDLRVVEDLAKATPPWILTPQERVEIPGIATLRGDPKNFPAWDAAWAPLFEVTGADGTVARVIGRGVGSETHLETQRPGREPVVVNVLPVGAEVKGLKMSPDKTKAGLWIRFPASDAPKASPDDPVEVTDDLIVFPLDGTGTILLRTRPEKGVMHFGDVRIGDNRAELNKLPEPGNFREKQIVAATGGDTLRRWYMFDGAVTDLIKEDRSWSKWGAFVLVPEAALDAPVVEVRAVAGGEVLHKRTVHRGTLPKVSMDSPAGLITYDLPVDSVPGAQSFLLLNADGGVLLDGLPSYMFGKSYSVVYSPQGIDVSCVRWVGNGGWATQPSSYRYFTQDKIWMQSYGGFLPGLGWGLFGNLNYKLGERMVEWRAVDGTVKASYKISDKVTKIVGESLEDGIYAMVRAQSSGQGGLQEDVRITARDGRPVVDGVDPAVPLKVESVGSPLFLRLSVWRGFAGWEPAVWYPEFESPSPVGGWGVRLSGRILGASRALEVTDGNGHALSGPASLVVEPFGVPPAIEFTPTGSAAVLFSRTELPGTGMPGGNFLFATRKDGFVKGFDGGHRYSFEGPGRFGTDATVIEPSALFVPTNAFRLLPPMSVFFDGRYASENLIPKFSVFGGEPEITLPQKVLLLRAGGGTASFVLADRAMGDLAGTPSVVFEYASQEEVSFQLSLLDFNGNPLHFPSSITVVLPSTGGETRKFPVSLGSLLIDPKNTIVETMVISAPTGAADIFSFTMEGKGGEGTGGGTIEPLGARVSFYLERWLGKTWGNIVSRTLAVPLLENALFTLPAAVAAAAAGAAGLDIPVGLGAYVFLSIPYIFAHQSALRRRDASLIRAAGLLVLLLVRPDAFWIVPLIHGLFNAGVLLHAHLRASAARLMPASRAWLLATPAAAAMAVLSAASPARAQEGLDPYRSDVVRGYVASHMDTISRSLAAINSYPVLSGSPVLSFRQFEASGGVGVLALTPSRRLYQDPNVVFNPESQVEFNPWTGGGLFPWVMMRLGLGRNIDVGLHYALLFGSAPGPGPVKDISVMIHNVGGHGRWGFSFWRDRLELTSHLFLGSSFGTQQFIGDEGETATGRLSSVTGAAGSTLNIPWHITPSFELSPYVGASAVFFSGAMQADVLIPNTSTSDPSLSATLNNRNFGWTLHGGLGFDMFDMVQLAVGAQLGATSQVASFSTRIRFGGPKKKAPAAPSPAPRDAPAKAPVPVKAPVPPGQGGAIRLDLMWGLSVGALALLAGPVFARSLGAPGWAGLAAGTVILTAAVALAPHLLRLSLRWAKPALKISQEVRLWAASAVSGAAAAAARVAAGASRLSGALAAGRREARFARDTRDLARALVRAARFAPSAVDADDLLKGAPPSELISRAAEPRPDPAALAREMAAAAREPVTAGQAFEALASLEIRQRGAPAGDAVAAALREDRLGVFVLTDRTQPALPAARAAARAAGRTLVVMVAGEDPGLSAAAHGAALPGEPVLPAPGLLKFRSDLPALLPMADMVGILTTAPETAALLKDASRPVALALPAGVEVDWSNVKDDRFREAVIVILDALRGMAVTREDLEGFLAGARLAATHA